MAASGEALLHFVSVASDAPATSGAGPPPEGRDWRGRKDGGNNASADTVGTDASVEDRTLRSRGVYHKRFSGLSGSFARTSRGDYESG